MAVRYTISIYRNDYVFPNVLCMLTVGFSEPDDGQTNKIPMCSAPHKIKCSTENRCIYPMFPLSIWYGMDDNESKPPYKCKHE
jgi:hypothetical protein